MALKEQLLISLKKAMQGEMDSVTLYASAAKHAVDIEVKEFFLSRKEEERLHYNYLLQYYQEISNEYPQPSDLSKTINDAFGDHTLISQSFMRRIGEDQVLFSAISTALLLEKDAIEHYRSSLEQTDNLTLKAFYELMIRWESKHYDDLLAVQKEAEQYYWQINQFEPF